MGRLSLARADIRPRAVVFGRNASSRVEHDDANLDANSHSHLPGPHNESLRRAAHASSPAPATAPGEMCP